MTLDRLAADGRNARRSTGCRQVGSVATDTFDGDTVVVREPAALNRFDVTRTRGGSSLTRLDGTLQSGRCRRHQALFESGPFCPCPDRRQRGPGSLAVGRRSTTSASSPARRTRRASAFGAGRSASAWRDAEPGRTSNRTAPQPRTRPMFYAAAGASRPSATPSTARPTARSTPRSCSGSRASRGRSSLLYHLVPPTRTHRIEPVPEIVIEEADDGYHHHRLIDAAGVEPHGDAVTGRIPLFFNSDVVMGVVRPADAMPETVFYRNGEADELLFVHEGDGPARHGLRADPLRPGRLPRPADRHDLAARPGRRLRPADALPRMPVGDRGAEALSQRLRPAAGALAVLAARHPAARARSRPGPTRATSASTSRCATG